MQKRIEICRAKKMNAGIIVGVSIEEAVGVLLIVLGLVIWIKKAVSLLHTYHYKHVEEEDIPAYCRVIGIALILMGVGLCITGVLNLFESAWWWIPLTVGFVVGIAVFIFAQKKYNGSIF